MNFACNGVGNCTGKVYFKLRNTSIETQASKFSISTIFPFHAVLLQVEAIKSFVSGKDTFVILPTGYGKSIIYGVLPLLFDYVSGE